ncbi:MAG: CDP-glucose 4,6-dehydratase [Verrucomicrobia bacterium]|nr:CDP-glucose 4,6-dehydratase [Verrucomicrobiota bacterium]
MFGNFYRGKRVLVTGHTGFKGSWLGLWLKHLGASVHGLGLAAPTTPSLYESVRASSFNRETECDVRDLSKLQSSFEHAAPEVIFHLAAQPLVRQSYADPVETFTVNALGTLHVLEAVRRLELPCAIVVVTTDKCYENRSWEFAYRENDPLGGHDVYSTSKAAAEILVDGWRKSFFGPNPKLGPVASARAGNVIGGGDYAPERIVPDCIRALLEQRAISIRHPAATRPWQHAFDCLSGYLWLGARLAQLGKTSPAASAFNFGPGPHANLPVSALVQEILGHWPGEWHHTPDPNAPHEAAKLNLAIDKAAALLGWHPVWEFAEAVQHTVAWYRQRHLAQDADMTSFSLAQIQAYTQAAQRKGLAWASPQCS